MRLFRIYLVIFALLTMAWPVHAQDSAAMKAPSFTAQSLETRASALADNQDLSDDQRAQAKAFLTNAKERLADATRQTELRAQYLNEASNIETIRQDFDTRIAAAQAELSKKPEPMGEMIGEAALFSLEQDLIVKEGELATLQSRLQSLSDEMQALAGRQVTAPQELSDARSNLADIQTALSQLGDAELEAISGARRLSLQARQWYRFNQIRALEQEISTLPARQNILGARRNLADLQAKRLSRDVQLLAERTGQKRLNEAQALRNQYAAEVEATKNAHPLIQSFAAGNLDLAEQIAAFALDEPGVSQLTAITRGRLVNVQDDLTAARQLVDSGHLDREAGATLRRLGNQLLPTSTIRANMRDTQTRLATATRQRILAQEELRDLPLGQFDLDAALADARADTPTLPDVTEADEQLLAQIVDKRRQLLREIIGQSTTRRNDISEWLTVQKSLLNETQALESLLDENLLWVRSVPAINKDFPRKVILGAAELFSIQHLRLATTELFSQIRNYWLLVAGFFLVIGGIVRLRPRLRADVVARGKKVGRVRQDSAWHTPAVIAAGVFNSLPFPLLFLLVSLLYNLSDSPERLIEGLGNAFAYLSFFTLFFLAWIRWDRKNGLFDAHFKLPEHILHTISFNLRWFVPFAAVTTTLLALTNDMSDTNISEGFAVFVFILTALALIIFAARTLWGERRNLSGLVPPDSVARRFRGPISAVIVGMPLVALGLAAAGYFESADELLGRLFLTGGLVLLTYVFYGSVRRAIVVAQRQMKYEQALERRETELQARRDKEAAEIRGEEVAPPPPIDTKEIDVSTMTRQSSQLLRTAVLLGFAALLWMIWAPLLPALSIFDGFDIWTYTTGQLDEAGVAIQQVVTLWDILQAIVIIILTFIAARNLPGFLEIFVLSRLGVDAGTRYAVVTVLGYIIVAAGIIIGFNQLGLQWSQLKWIATGLSVGIGFGLQKIIANFVSGLIILFERPIRIGDYVTIGDQAGIVSRIKIRATTLMDLDNREILIPNEALISERVTNWTLSSSVTRLTVPVGIAYGSDTDKARDLMLETLKGLPKVVDNPPPQVLFMGFGDSSLNFQLRVYLRNFDDRVPMTHTIHTEINRTLAKAGISIPFPQRDLNIVSQDIPLEFLARNTIKAKVKSKPKAKPKTTPKSGRDTKA